MALEKAEKAPRSVTHPFPVKPRFSLSAQFT